MKYNFRRTQTLINKYSLYYLGSYIVTSSQDISSNKCMIGQNQLTINTDRDSVCAGDDCTRHDTEFLITDSCNIIELLEAAWLVSPLASISGGKGTWLIDVGLESWSCIGVMAQEWAHPKLIIPENTAVKLLFKDRKPSLYFRYWCQADPEQVYEAVRLNQSLPDKYL